MVSSTGPPPISNGNYYPGSYSTDYERISVHSNDREQLPVPMDRTNYAPSRNASRSPTGTDRRDTDEASSRTRNAASLSSVCTQELLYLRRILTNAGVKT